MKPLILSFLFLSAGAVQAACPTTVAEAKAGRAAVAVEKNNRGGANITVVTQGIRGQSSSEFMIDVQVRGSELGGNVWNVVVNRRTCNVEEVKLSLGLESVPSN